MNIDKDNFDATLDKIKADIDASEFIAIDLELSGITKQNKPTPQSFVNAGEYYEIHKSVSSTFQILQVGLCTFKRIAGEEKEQKYSCFPYNFFIFPEFHGKRGEDNIIQFSADATQFLRNYKFDFNRVFYKGVPYMKKEEEQKAITFWEEYFAKQKEVALTEEDQGFINKLLERVTEGISKLEGTESIFPVGKFVEFDWKQRKLIYQELPKRFSKIVVEKQQIEGHDSLIAKYDSAAVSALEKKKKEIQGWVGFRHVMDHITKSGKPIVGHNCFLDMLFLTQSFATDLQEKTYAEFKKIVLESFPAIYDTKYVINTLVPTLKETNLEKVHNFVINGEFDKVHPNTVTCSLDPSITYAHAAHEAGYDAYMTGVIFAKQKAVATSEQLKTIANCVFLMGCEQSPMSLTREEGAVDLTKAFLVTNFPSTFTNDTFQEEARFGPNIRIRWVSDTSCLVILQAPLKEGDDVAARVKALPDWEVVALHEVEHDNLAPAAKKIKV